MPMKPKPGESQSDFSARCVPEMMGPDGKKRDQDQAVAICLDIWRNKDKALKAAPDDYDNRDEFMRDCISETGDEDACALAWEERAAKVVHKTHVTPGEGLEFILSDATPDRMGDVIDADGWDLANFKNNPVALFNHNPNFPIGKWINLRTGDGRLRGHLQLAKKGTSDRINEIISLVEQNILRAVSVGFLPRKSEPLTKGGSGLRFKQTELVETSLVSIPANPNALAVARSLNISASTTALVFGGKANTKDQSMVKRGFNGGQAESPPVRKNRIMSPLTKRIEQNEQRLVELRDQLTAHLEAVDDENVTDADLATTQELNKKIADQEALYASLKESEGRLAKTSSDGNGDGNTRVITGKGGERRPFSLKAKTVDPIEFLVRAGTVRALARSMGVSIDDARQKVYGDDEATRMICDLTLKAASAPAMTTVTGWAAELVQQIVADMMPALLPASVYPSLSALGLKLTFGRNGRIIVPTRSLTPTVAGSFVGEGAPIPVRQAAFTSQTLTPKKMAVISTWTREMDEHSVPAIEGLLREAIQQDTAISIDSVLLDTNAATAIRPAGLRNGVAGLTPTPIGAPPNAFNALVTDLKQLTGAILTATNGNIRNMVFIMNPQQALSISFIQPPVPGGLFPFRDEVNAGRLNGRPLITSGTVPLGTVICLDAADYVSVSGDTPRFEISDQATLHMEDTNPQQLAAAGTAPVVAAPAQSMFQTDSLALRLILPMNWALRRQGVVAWIAGVTW
ncbi:phage major capsid protein [Bradyrhizobium sp. SRL28]|uniref:phage major capsid protein n=1 Tax=Bradyrhizobium sp. SRL28 TaxID=2836178 RepID=UPI001BDE7C8D|nr:phage major capsid protein [Bradyrhizobium sp. SRL28]MBT1509418.1 phage major capsid protein [Bradyrhizobium sp. SRL28]